jgi:HAMP domain-containing protein
MLVYLFIIRFLHVFSAIFWVGTTLFMAFFLEPTLRALGPEGGKVMQRLLSGTRFALAISASGIVTVLAGVLLYAPVTGMAPAVMFGARLPLTLGALAGIAAAAFGGAVQGRASGRMRDLGQQIAAQGKPPSPEQLAEIGALQASLRQGSLWSVILMVVAVIGMTW